MTAVDDRILVLAPIGRDAFVVRHELAPSGITAVTADSMSDLIAKLHEGIGALLITEEAVLSGAELAKLVAALAEQPAWSDLPIVMLLREGSSDATPLRQMLRTTRSITMLQRPVPALTLVTSVQMALSTRHRQYDVRDLLVREREARERAEEAGRVKDQFLASVSHELRTPMSAILLWSQLLESGRVTGEAATRAIAGIAASARAQSNLIEDLLDQSRILTGKLRIDLVPQQLAPILSRSLDVMRPTAEAKGVRLDLSVEATDTAALADADRVQQILWNLLSNAIKFTPSGGVVTIRLVADADHITVTVADTGEGISSELLPYVFDSFRKGRTEDARRRSGLGLGLSIVRYLVELHGGTIHADSAGPGQGAIFTLRFPALRESVAVASR